ncbi:248_t:CDS:2 [Ambispora leptoticha]|uniref:248_t:CDS:1 n=1 Tax=Ambispora leptoticha TaxID=144679 RepID=A0A9N9GK29_9GLOM|nr:248_t:CDS:2 [Ambispora leptoticha]
MNRRKSQAQVYRSWNALALDLPSKPGEPEPEEPEIKPTKSAWRPPPGVLVKEVIGQKAPRQIAEWRYSNAFALNKVSDILREKTFHESEQKQRKENLDTSSARSEQQNDWDLVEAKKLQTNWNASEHDNNWDSSIDDNDSWNSVTAKKQQNTSVQPEQTAWTLTDEPKEINHISPVVNTTLGAFSQIKHDETNTWNEEKFNHLVQSAPQKDVPSKTKHMDNTLRSSETRQSQENVTKIKASNEKTQIRGSKVKIAGSKIVIASSIDTRVSKIDDKNSGTSDTNKDTSLITPIEASPQVDQFFNDTKIEPKENPDYLKSNLLKTAVQSAEQESSRNAKYSPTVTLTQPSSKPKDKKVQKSSAKVDSKDPFQFLIDENFFFHGDQNTNVNKAEKSVFGWGSEFKHEENWPNFNQPLIESESSDEESVKSNSSTKELQSPVSPNLIDSFNVPPLINKPTTATTPNQKKPPEIKNPLRATIQSPESKTVASYIFYNSTFVKENSVLVNLDDDQSASSPPKQPPKKESEDFLQELAKLDWKSFLPIPDPDSIKWAKPTDREQKRKKKEVRRN